MIKIRIPTPCHEDWEKMTPDKTGHHCSACAKSVIDFTNMSDEEVKHFFINKKEDERICGRFKQTQLYRMVIELPANIFNTRMAYWKKFLAACLLVFSTTLFSCETKIGNNKHAINEFQELTGVIVVPPDTVPVSPPPPPPMKIIGVVFSTPQVLVGDIAIADSVISITDTTGNETLQPVHDTVYKELIGEPLLIKESVTTNKTKNPPKADSATCKTINNFY